MASKDWIPSSGWACHVRAQSNKRERILDKNSKHQHSAQDDTAWERRAEYKHCPQTGPSSGSSLVISSQASESIPGRTHHESLRVLTQSDACLQSYRSFPKQHLSNEPSAKAVSISRHGQRISNLCPLSQSVGILYSSLSRSSASWD